MGVRRAGPEVVSPFVLRSDLDLSTVPVDVYNIRFLKVRNLPTTRSHSIKTSATFTCHVCPVRVKYLYSYTSHLLKELKG